MCPPDLDYLFTNQLGALESPGYRPQCTRLSTITSASTTEYDVFRVKDTSASSVLAGHEPAGVLSSRHHE